MAQTPEMDTDSTSRGVGVPLPRIKPTRYVLGERAHRILRDFSSGAPLPQVTSGVLPTQVKQDQQEKSNSQSRSPSALGLFGLVSAHASTPYTPAGFTSVMGALGLGLGQRPEKSGSPSHGTFLRSALHTAASARSGEGPGPGADRWTPAANSLTLGGEALTQGVAGEGLEDGLEDGEDEELMAVQLMDDEDELTGRLLSLPSIMCHAANGDVFCVGLGDVQNMLHKRRLGPKGLQVLRRFETATLSKWDITREKSQQSVSLKWRQKHEQRIVARGGGGADGRLTSGDGHGSPGVPSSPSRPGARNARQGSSAVDAAQLGLGGLGLDPASEVEVMQHLAASMAKVEARRAHLHNNSPKALAEVEQQRTAVEVQKRTDEAVEFAVRHLVPEKILAMAMTRRHKGAATNQLFRRMKVALSPDLCSPEDVGDATTQHTPAPAEPQVSAMWTSLKIKTNEVLASMPFLPDWNAAISKLKRDDPQSGWDELLIANSVYVKGGSGDSQGTAVYVLKCQELGVIPSTQVVQQLRSVDANMAHCKVGRRGAQALRHALSTNTTITNLDLSDNGLDSHAVAEIIAGLTSGALAAMPAKMRRTLQDKWSRLDWVKAARVNPNGSEVAVSMMPASIQQKLDIHAQRSRSTSPEPMGLHRAPSPTRDTPGTSPLNLPTPMREAAARQGLGSPKRKPGKADDMRQLLTPKGGPSLLDSILSNVRSLDLSENLLGINGAKVLSDLLDPQLTTHQFIKELRLNKCGIPETGGVLLFRALSNGNNTLRVLCLSNNALGNASAAELGEQLRTNDGLQELDLSWNQIKPEGVRSLCVGLDDNTTLTKLILSWNGLENDGVVRLGQMLLVNEGLKHLDLTNTRMGGEACLMLGEGIKVNQHLEDLIVNGNSVGDDGARHLMHALKSNNTLQYLGLQGTNMSSAARGNSGAADFNPLVPDGSYALALGSTAERNVAQQLCALDAASKVDLMRNIKLEGRNVPSCKSQRWPAQLPVFGMLAFDFTSRRVQKVLQVMDSKKFKALVGQLDSPHVSDKEKVALVEVMAPFTYLNCHQVSLVLGCFSMGNELVRAAALMFTRAADLEESISQITSGMQEHDIQALHTELGWYGYYRYTNPTGHYEFNLTTSVHQALVGRLKDVAYGEPSDGNNWHNVIHDQYSHAVKLPSNYGPPEAWKGSAPTKGSLVLDFVANTPTPEGAQPAANDQLLDFLHHSIGLKFDDRGQPQPEPNFDEADLQLALLRQEVGHQFFFTISQVVFVMACFVAGAHKVEVAVLLYSLTLDRKGWWQVVYSLRAFEQGLLMWRLGPSNLFDRAHPTAHYILDLSNPAHEQVTRKLIELAALTPELPNFWNIRLLGNKKSMVENRNMYGTLTAESFTPWLEFDFIGADAPECLLLRPPAEWDPLGKGDKVELITKLSRRIEMQRVKDMYGYFWDGSGWKAPMWRTATSLFKPLLDKSPWLAAWDRLMRILVRFDMRSGDITSDSYLEDIYDVHSSDAGELSAEAFEMMCKEWGYTKGEIHYHYRRLFDSVAVAKAPDPLPGGESLQLRLGDAPSVPGSLGNGTPRISARKSRAEDSPLSPLSPGPGPGALPSPVTLQAGQVGSSTGEAPPVVVAAVPVVDFTTLVEMFMREPAPDLRWKELPVSLMASFAVAKAIRTLKKRS